MCNVTNIFKGEKFNRLSTNMLLSRRRVVLNHKKKTDEIKDIVTTYNRLYEAVVLPAYTYMHCVFTYISYTRPSPVGRGQSDLYVLPSDDLSCCICVIIAT